MNVILTLNVCIFFHVTGEMHVLLINQHFSYDYRGQLTFKKTVWSLTWSRVAVHNWTPLRKQNTTVKILLKCIYYRYLHACRFKNPLRCLLIYICFTLFADRPQKSCCTKHFSKSLLCMMLIYSDWFDDTLLGLVYCIQHVFERVTFTGLWCI